MQLLFRLTSRPAVSRRGVSPIEFIGYLAALGAGVVLGSMYLGIDITAVAVGVLEKADIEVPTVFSLESKFQEKTSGVEEPAAQDRPENSPKDLRSESDSTAQAAEAPAEAPSEVLVDAGESESHPKLKDEEKRAATQACWMALNRCLEEEASNRSHSIRDPGSWQLFDYLLHRKEGHERVVEAIEQLDRPGVDPRLLAHVEQVHAWHRDGVRLFGRAAHLLTDAPAGRLTGPFAQSWQSSATQHRMEEKLITNKHASVESYLDHAGMLSVSKSASPSSLD